MCLCYRPISQNIKTTGMLWEYRCSFHCNAMFCRATLAPGIYICYPAKHSCRLMTLPKKQGLALQWLQILPKTMTKSHISIGSTIEGMCHNEPDPPGKPQEPEDILPKSRAVPEPPEELRPCPERWELPWYDKMYQNKILSVCIETDLFNNDNIWSKMCNFFSCILTFDSTSSLCASAFS